MGVSVSEAIRVCLERAERCRQRAYELSHPGARQDFFDMEEQWRRLAGHFQSTERLSRSIQARGGT